MLELLLLTTATPSAPLAGSSCDSAEGVSVVVDFNELGGGLQQVCLPDGGGDLASELFPDAGFPLTYAQRQPGFVCRVREVPAEDPCVNTAPASAYWGLWWSDGETGEWTYSSLGAASLRVPDGGSAAFAWDGSEGEVRPGAPAPTHPAEPSPTTSPTPTTPPTTPPTPSATGTPSASPTPTPSPSDTATPSPTSSPTTSASVGPSPTATRSPTTSASPAATPSEAPAETASPDAAGATEPTATEPADGLQVWVAPAALALLAAAAGATAVLRRRSARP